MTLVSMRLTFEIQTCKTVQDYRYWIYAHGGYSYNSVGIIIQVSYDGEDEDCCG